MNKFRLFMAFIFCLGGGIVVAGLALSLVFRLSVAQPAKVSGWLDKNALYSAFISTSANSIDSSIGNQYNIGGLTVYIKQVAEKSLTRADFSSDLGSFISSNYSWLEGKSTKPDFSIDVSTNRQKLANNISGFIESQTESLPLCSEAQLIELENNAPNIPDCYPGTLSPKVLSEDIAAQVLASNAYLGNNKITADNIDLSSLNINQPYYKQYAKAPTYYKKALVAPYVLAVAALILFSLIIVISPRKLIGGHYIGLSFIIAAILTYLALSPLKSLLSRVKDNILSSNFPSTLTGSVNSFFNNGQSDISKLDKYASVILLAIGLILLLALWGISRKRRLA